MRGVVGLCFDPFAGGSGGCWLELNSLGWLTVVRDSRVNGSTGFLSLFSARVARGSWNLA